MKEQNYILQMPERIRSSQPFVQCTKREKKNNKIEKLHKIVEAKCDNN